jgi:hypothetical protein
MGETDLERRALAAYLTGRRAAMLDTWRDAIKRDPAITSGDSLPRVQRYDHIPGILATFERELQGSPAEDRS